MWGPYKWPEINGFHWGETAPYKWSYGPLLLAGRGPSCWLRQNEFSRAAAVDD